jgi:hypothetical protein
VRRNDINNIKQIISVIGEEYEMGGTCSTNEGEEECV